MSRKNSGLRSASMALALEPRLLFDGAGAVAVADSFDAGQGAYVEPPDSDHTPAADARPSEALEQGPGSETLLIIDARVADHQSLLADLPGNVTVRVIGVEESGIAVISEALAEGGDFDAVHIVSHGSAGALSLGSDAIRNDTLAGQSEALQGWAQHLAADADILLYGCDIAQGEAGQALVTELARLTGADIAASTNATGSAEQGGDWVLERQTGRIEAATLSGVGFAGLLVAPTLKDVAPADAPTSVGENTGGKVGEGIEISGTGSDVLTVTASVAKGTLSQTSFTGNAAAVQAWLASLTYSYSGISETGDSDRLSLSVVNITTGGTTTFTRDFAVTAENDAPTLTPPASGAGRLTVKEGGSVTFSAGTGNGTVGSPVNQINLGLVDLDNTRNQVIIKITSLPAHGLLKLNGNELAVGSTFAVSDINKLEYQHTGGEVLSTTTDAFLITVDDGAGGLLTNQQVTIDITPDNDAPSAGGNIVLIEGENGVALVGGLLPVIGGARGDLAIGDPDDAQGTHSVQITDLPDHGTLKYDGVAVTPGQIITNADLSKFTYDHDGSEATTDSFKLIVTDAGGGEGVVKSSGERTIGLTVIPNNDDPLWNNDPGKGAVTLPDGTNSFGPLVFGRDSGTANAGSVVITQDMLHAVDTESGPEKLTYTLTAIPSGGYLTHADHPGKFLPVGFTFTQKDIADGKIGFVSTTGSDHSTEFKFTVMDGDRRLIPTERDGGIYADDSATALTVHTFKIEYRGTETGPGPGSEIAAAPLPTIGDSMKLTALQIAEGQHFTLGAAELSAASTGSTAEQLTYRLLSLPSNGSILLNGTPLGLLGSFTQADIDAGRVRFRHDGSEDFTASFTFDVSNGSQISGLQTFNIDVKPQNDTPVAGQGDPVKLTEGSSIVINGAGKTHIALNDGDNAASDKTDGYAADNALSFMVTALPAYGELWLNGVKQTAAGFVVTQAELNAGKLEYRHGGSENYTDSFTIVPLDNANVASTLNNSNANAHAPATDPTNQSSTGAATIIQIGINPLNDAPTYVDKAEPGYGGKPALKEGGEFTLWGADSYTSGSYATGSGSAVVPVGKDHYLIYQDSDNSSEQRQYRITAAPKYGTLTVDGQVLGVGSVFTQADLDSGKVKYKHGGGEQFDDKFEYVVSDGDYTSNAGTSNNATAALQGNSITPSEYRIRLERSNDKPIITGPANDYLMVIDSSNPTNAKAFPSIKLTDTDLSDGVQVGEFDFVQVTVEFLDASNALYDNGVLQFESGFNPAAQGYGVIVTDGVGDNKLVFQGKRADVEAALAKVQARTNGTDADIDTLKIKITIDDRLRNDSGTLTGSANGGALNQDGTAPNDTFNTASITFKVAASDRNDPAIVTVPAAPIVVNEDVRTHLTGGSAISYTDPDAFDSTSNTITLSVSHGSLYFAASGNTVTGGATVSAGAVGSATVTLTGTKTQLDIALANLYYQGKTDYNGADSLSVTANDGNKNGQDGTDNSGSGSSSGTVAIYIRPVNDAPTLTLPNENNYQSITGGSYTFSSGNGNAIVIADAKDFSNSGQPGQQDGMDDEFTVTLTAKQGSSGYGTITIATPGSVVIANNGTDTVTLTGSRADINAALAAGVTYTPAGTNLNGTIEFTVLVDDKQNGGSKLTDPNTGTAGVDGTSTVSKKLYFQPTDINEAPGFSGLDATPTFVQGGPAIVLDANALLSDAELDLFGASGNWSGAVLTLQRDGGANAGDKFGFTGSGSTGVNVSGSALRIGIIVVGTLSNSGGTLTITFNGAATAARVDQVLQAITYQNTEASPGGSVRINYTIDDQNPNTGGSGTAGSGQDQGTGGKLAGTGSITIGVNRQVVAAPDINSIDEAVSVSDPITVSGDVSPGTNNNDNGGSQDRDPDAGQTITVQGVKAGNAGSVSGVGSSNVGMEVTGTYGKVVINANGTYTYTLDNTNPTVNALKPGDAPLTDVFSYAINDTQGANSTFDWSTLTITINGRNDPPVAVDDNNVVVEDASTPVTGNVKTGVSSNGTDSTADSDVEGNALTVTQIRPGKEADGGAMTGISGSTTSANGTEIVGQYGTLKIGADGSYTYAVDNTNLTVQGLASGETLKDEFTYTLSDGLATDQATLSVTINGVDDPVSVTVPSSTVQTSPDGNVTDQVVFESGLAGGSNPHTADTKVDASFTLVALDGLDASAAIVIGYIDASGNPASLTLTKAEVEALDSTNKSIATQYGILVFDGYERGSDGTISIDYTYTLTSAPPVGGDSTNDSFTFTAKDGDGDTDAKVLNIKIVDDVPKAVVDTSAVKAGETLTATAVDGVLKNDKSGADGWVTGGAVVGVVKGGVGTSASGINTDIAGDYGTLKLQADGSYTYIANAAAPGAAPTTSDVFTYTVRDADGDETTSTLTITIQNNRQPVAMDDSRTTPEDTPLSGNVIGSGGTGDVADGDPDGDTLAVTKIVVEGVTYPVPANGSPLNVSIPGKGVLQFDKTGAYTFTPVADWHGAVPDITYTIDDGRGASNSTAPATLSIIVTPVADVADDTATTRPSMPVTIPVLANDSFEGTPVVTGTTPPSNGTLTINADNTITYTPNPGFFGADSYTYMVTSGGVTETATVTVTVVSTPPLARDDVRTTPEDTPVRGNVLIGTGGDMADSDADNDPLTVTGFIVGGVSYIPGQTATIAGVGSLTLNADGSYTFTPVPDWNGSVPVVSYVVSDGTGASNSTAIATLTIVVTPVADVADDTATTRPSMPVTIPVLANDSFEGTPVVTGTTPPSNGTLTINADNTITYTPNPGFFGADSYTYMVTSGGVTETATVTVTVVSTPPLARDDVRTTPEDTPVRGNVLIGTGGDMADSDADNDPLTVTGFIVGGVSYIPGQTATIAGVGSLTLNADGSYTFTPVPDWNGSVPVVSYVVSDGTGASNSTAIATLTIVVTPVADVADDTATTLANRPVTTPVLGNDSFGNPDATITATTPPANGSIAINPDGSITYVPNPGFSGEDSYSYTVKSGGRTETATVRITVVPENPPSVVPPFEVVPPAPSLNVLQPANPLDRSPVILEPGPYFAGERFDDVRRLPLPFHPITYVHQQVVVSQTERAQDDPRAFGDPRAVTPDEYRPISLGAGLGFDPNLFVVHSVRDSQRMASDFDRMVEGRFGRIELDSDRYLLQPGLFHDGEHEIPSWLKQQEADGTQPTPTADEAATVPTDDADTPPPETDRPAAVSTRPSGGGAPSFAEQLRSGASRLPLAPRKV
ncbi:MAG TPA: Ig-like domain-containing protein [Thauera sp.]|nr:Ig-like domain-containing protein [Thauera sp.]